MDAPDEATPASPRRWWISLILFIATFSLLDWGWETARGSLLERLVVHDATVGLAAQTIRHLTPAIDAQALGGSIRASGGGLNVLRGCEGTEVFFLLVAALVAHPLRWPVRLVGLLAGGLLVFALNQVRLVALFYSFRANRELFDQLHGLVTPLLLVALTLVFFLLLLRWNERSSPPADTALGSSA